MFYLFKSVAVMMVVFAVDTHGAAALAAHPDRVVWEGDKGPVIGNRIVFIAVDHEYRS